MLSTYMNISISKLHFKLRCMQCKNRYTCFAVEIHINTTVSLIGKSFGTIIDRYTMCRVACGALESDGTRGKKVGAEKPGEIDEAKSGGGRKCNRGRMLNGSQHPLSPQDSHAAVQSRRNQGCRRIVGGRLFVCISKHNDD